MAATAKARAFAGLGLRTRFISRASTSGCRMVASGAPRSLRSTRPPGNTKRPGRNLCPAWRRPSSTLGVASERSTRIRVAASRQRWFGWVRLRVTRVSSWANSCLVAVSSTLSPPAAAAPTLRPGRAGRCPTLLIAPFRQEFESQRPGDRRRLDQAYRHLVAEPMGLAAVGADQRMPVLVIAEVLVADLAGRDEAVGAGLVELHEQAGAGRTRDVAREGRADAV